MLDALALIELDSVARGYRVMDALVKKAPVTVLEANLVEPGKFLILFGGDVASVDESYAEALESGASSVLDKLMLPMVHEHVVTGLKGTLPAMSDPDTIGVVETKTVSSGLWACDRVLKDAYVELAGLRITPGLGGKAFFVFHGVQHDVEAALDVVRELLGEGQLHHMECVPRPHEDFLAFVLRPAPFSMQS